MESPLGGDLSDSSLSPGSGTESEHGMYVFVVRGFYVLSSLFSCVSRDGDRGGGNEFGIRREREG